MIYFRCCGSIRKKLPPNAFKKYNASRNDQREVGKPLAVPIWHNVKFGTLHRFMIVINNDVCGLYLALNMFYVDYMEA